MFKGFFVFIYALWLKAHDVHFYISFKAPTFVFLRSTWKFLTFKRKGLIVNTIEQTRMFYENLNNAVLFAFHTQVFKKVKWR